MRFQVRFLNSDTLAALKHKGMVLEYSRNSVKISKSLLGFCSAQGIIWRAIYQWWSSKENHTFFLIHPPRESGPSGITWQACLTRFREMLNLGVKEVKLLLAGISLIEFWKQVTLFGSKKNPLPFSACTHSFYVTVFLVPLACMYLQTDTNKK